MRTLTTTIVITQNKNSQISAEFNIIPIVQLSEDVKASKLIHIVY